MPVITEAIHLLGLRNDTCIHCYTQQNNIFNIPVVNVYTISKLDNKLFFKYEYVYKNKKVSMCERIHSVSSVINNEKIESVLVPNETLIITLKDDFTFIIKPILYRKELLYGEIV